jgi:hypothetical protein
MPTPERGRHCFLLGLFEKFAVFLTRNQLNANILMGVNIMFLPGKWRWDIGKQGKNVPGGLTVFGFF